MGRASRKSKDRRDKVSRIPPELKEQTPEQLVARANEQAEAGQLAEAEETLETAVVLHPRHAECWSALGMLRFVGGDFPGALEALSEALDLDHEDVHTLRAMAQALLSLDRHEDAEGALRAAIALEPAEASQWFLLGITYDHLEELSMAALAYAESIRLDPDHASAHWHLGNVLWFLDRAAEAEGRFHDAIRLDPEVPEAHSGLGVMLLDLRRYAEAEGPLRVALRLEPREWPAAAALAQVLAHTGRPDEAREQMAAAEALVPRDDEEAVEVIAAARERMDEALAAPAGSRRPE